MFSSSKTQAHSKTKPLGKAPATRLSNKNSAATITNAATKLAVSKRPTAGRTRRRGMTNQLVIAKMNGAKGLPARTDKLMR